MKKLLITATLLLLLSLKPLFAGVAEGVDVKEVQTLLTKLCFNAGPIDGLWGQKTAKAAKEFLASRSKKYSGTFEKKHAAVLRRTVNSKAHQDTFGHAAPQLCEIETKENINPNKIYDFGSSSEIPDSIERQPNDATLEYYYKKSADKLHKRFKINGSSNPRTFSKKLESHPIIEDEMATKTILSYLYFEDGKIVYDALPPPDRFNFKFDNSSYFPSHSMGKSITSYLVGHAICEGYISSVDAPIEDWPLMERTLYYGQPLIKLLNMQAGDTHIIPEKSGKFTKTGRNIHGNAPLLVAAKNPLELLDTKPKANAMYSYSNLTSDIIFNYIMHRAGKNFESFIRNFYQTKVGIENPVYLWMNPLVRRSHASKMMDLIQQGAGQYGISATRYDLLRIAVAMMEDWQNNTCEGKYLKEIHKRSVPKSEIDYDRRWNSSVGNWGKADFGGLTDRYSGQFHSNIVGLKNRDILVMIGANGQQIVIDFENTRIVAIAAVKSRHYNTYRLGFQPIRYGRIR